MEALVWLSYDLGVRGDYEGLYRWLASHDAKECGNGLACFTVEAEKGENLAEKVKAEIMANLKIQNGERIYLIYKKGNGQFAGIFVIGNRRANPWEGYKEQPVQEDC